MQEIFLDVLVDSIKMVPLLLVIYIGIELFEYKFGNKIRELIQKARSLGPAIGAFSGSLPQCGFSVIVTALYTQRLATIGTLLAVYLSTSDEAIPIILSQPEKAGIILPLITTKIIIALLAGYLIDLIFKKRNKATLEHINTFALGSDNKNHHHELILDKTACCQHSLSSFAKKFDYKEIFIHPIFHTFKIFLFIFGTSLFISLIIFWMGEDTFNRLFSGNLMLQPFLVALIGLIPNCASSVAITELYLKGTITYGSVIAGLSAGGGLGVLVLFKEEKNKKDVFKIITLLYGISVLAGVIIQTF